MRSAVRHFLAAVRIFHRQIPVLCIEPGASAHLQPLDEMLEEEGGLAGAAGKILLHLLALLPAEGRVGEDGVVAILFLHIAEILRERVRMDDVRCLDPVPDQVHDRDDIGEGLFLLSVESAILQESVLRCGALGILLPQVVEGLAEEAR